MSNFVFIFWHWWVLAVVLLAVEILAPGFFFLWMAIAAFVTGLSAYVMPFLSLGGQVTIFSGVAIVTILSVQYVILKKSKGQQPVLLNQRGAQYLGRIVNLYEPIENGQGKIKVDDSIWKVYGKDCGIKSRVKIMALKGTAFEVEKVE